jgi:hypothetical protein
MLDRAGGSSPAAARSRPGDQDFDIPDDQIVAKIKPRG